MHSSAWTGAAAGGIAMAIPDGVMSFLGKVAVGLVVAFVSAAGHWLFRRLVRKIT